MKKFTILKGIAAVMPDINIDTDAIIPKQFLKTIHRKGLGKSLFYNERYTEGYNKNVDFILNKDPWSNSSIIIAGENFGCGSSREHAPWALLDFGIQCIISNSFADFNVDPIIKDRLIHGYDDIEITLKNKQLIVDYENNKNKFHIWKNIVYEKQ